MVMAALIKVAIELPIGQILFVRSVIIIPFLLAYVVWTNQVYKLKTKHLGMHLTRTLLGLAAVTTWFLALRYLPLHDVTALLYLSPILSVIFGALILKEKVGLFRSGAVLAGVVGMLIIMAPKLGGSYGPEALIGVGLCILNTICFSLSLIQIRQMSDSEDSLVIVFYFSLFSSLFTLPTVAMGWEFSNPDYLLILLGIGVFGGLGQLFMTLCYRYAPVSVIAPFEYSTLIWALLIGYFMFDEVAEPSTLIGACLIVCAGLVVAYRERLLALANKDGIS